MYINPKPEMTLERVAARIRHLLHHNHDPLDRIGIYNCESCDGVRKILEEAEQAARRAALSTPRITRGQFEAITKICTCGVTPSRLEARLRELGIAVDPPTEAERAARMEVLGITDQDIADTMPPKQEDGYGR